MEVVTKENNDLARLKVCKECRKTTYTCCEFSRKDNQSDSEFTSLVCPFCYEPALCYVKEGGGI
jgi:hypothetical protein